MAIVASVLVLVGCAPAPIETPTPLLSPAPTPTRWPADGPPPSAPFDASTFSIDDPDSIWVVADKLRPLEPSNYAPRDLVTLTYPHRAEPRLRSGAASAYTAMYNAAKADGLTLVILSAYRSYSVQVAVYNGWVNRLGVDKADLQSARPGFSEHQTGLSVDIAAKNGRCTIADCFGDTPEGKWLTENAWKFGWVLRYPEGLTSITGYKYEPWHWRYVGRGLAAELRETSTPTLEEFFGLPPAPDYAD